MSAIVRAIFDYMWEVLDSPRDVEYAVTQAVLRYGSIDETQFREQYTALALTY